MDFGGEDGSVVVSGSYDATVRLWDCKSQSTKPIQVLEEARDSVSTLHVVGHEIVTGSVDGRMRVYDLRMGMILVDVIGRMSFLAFVNSGSLIEGAYRTHHICPANPRWQRGSGFYA